MNSQHSGRRTWLCRWADRLGVVTGDDAGERQSSLHRLARRHVEQCAHCQAEREEWAQMRVQLRALARSSAPSDLLDGVMAKIAFERAREGAVASQAAYTEARRVVSAGKTLGMRVVRGVMSATVLAAMGLGSVGSAVVGRSTVAAVSWTWPEIAAATRAVVVNAFYSTNDATLQVGPAGPLLAALLWGLTGVSVAMAVVAVAETAASDS